MLFYHRLSIVQLPLDTFNLNTDEATLGRYHTSISGLVRQLYERQQYFGKQTVYNTSPNKEHYECLADATTTLRKKADSWHKDIFKFRTQTHKDVIEAGAKERMARLGGAGN